MSTFLILILASIIIALVIGFTILALNGDDGSAWSHNALRGDEEHHWE